MAEPKKVVRAGRRNVDGIEVVYVRRRRILRMSGWYRGVRQIPPKEIPLREFVRALGITEQDFARLLKDAA